MEEVLHCLFTSLFSCCDTTTPKMAIPYLMLRGQLNTDRQWQCFEGSFWQDQIARIVAPNTL